VYYGAEFTALGNEPTQKEHINSLVAVFREVRRVLRPDGTFWLNYGDMYYKGKEKHKGLPAKEKHRGLPATAMRLALAMIDDGWILLSTNIWHKPNAHPQPVKRHPALDFEYVFQFAKSEQPYFDYVGVMQDAKCGGKRRLRTVWSINKASKTGIKHVATMPEELVDLLLRASAPVVGCCSECGAPWRRVVRRVFRGKHPVECRDQLIRCGRSGGTQRITLDQTEKTEWKTLGFEPGCSCFGDTVPGRVLDPFVGSGTTLMAAQKYFLDGVGIDINELYVRDARLKLEAQHRANGKKRSHKNE